jgi:hypothetical protein
MPTKYIFLVVGIDEKDNTSMKVLISKITKLKKLQQVRMQAVKTT